MKVPALEAVTVQDDNTIYDPNPNHLWNRLNETLFIRTAQDGKKYGLNELDILYWRNTKNLLIEPSHHKALAILDEFIHTHGEKLIHDPRAGFDSENRIALPVAGKISPGAEIQPNRPA
jgi:hypothetical protein